MIDAFQVCWKRHSVARRKTQAGAIPRIACSKSKVKSKYTEQLAGPKLVAEQAHARETMAIPIQANVLVDDTDFRRGFVRLSLRVVECGSGRLIMYRPGRSSVESHDRQEIPRY